MEWFKPQPLPWQAGGGQALAPNPWTGQPNMGMDLPNMGPAPTWGVGPQPDQPAWPQALGGAPNWQGMPDGMQQGQDDDPIQQILEVTSTTPPEAAPDFISFMRQQDPHDVGMALALFQQSFTDPQGALQWAFQLKQSRDAQRARMEQKQVEVKIKSEQDKEKKSYAQAYQLRSQADTTARLAGVDPSEFWQSNPNLNPDDPADMALYSKWALAKSADVKAKEQEEKKLAAGRKSALAEATKSGVAPKGYENDPVITAAAELRLAQERRANEYKQMASDRESQLSGLRGKGESRAEDAKRAQGLMQQLNQADKDINRYEQNILTLKNNPTYAFLAPDDPARAAYDQMIVTYMDRMEEATSLRDGLQARWNALFDQGAPSKPTASPAGQTPAPASGVDEEDLKLLPEDVEGEFIKSYMALTDPAKKERFIKFMEKKYPGYLITPPAE